ncbi:hypothetical protein [Nocardia pneumoniae]|uniref:hypothetical protein n=1 Tax=Nocardia pneumoniae TaxID=228601 RepID=UPI00068824E7|nr:hypothetical protein [Nocardia pneumoniae]
MAVRHAVASRLSTTFADLSIPAVTAPRSKRWTFLTVPDENRLFAELFRLNVSVSRFGAQIALPSPGARQAGFRVWVLPPLDAFRLSGMAVIESVRACQPQRRR